MRNSYYNYTKGQIISGLWFGLINFECDNVKGILTSKLECKPCSVFCTYNELIPSCKNFTIPLILSLVLSLILTIILFAILYKQFLIVPNSLYYHIHHKKRRLCLL